jgi:hypothetical protein
MPVYVLPNRPPAPPAGAPEWAWLCVLGTVERPPAGPLRTVADSRGRNWVLVPYDLRQAEADAALGAAGFAGGGAFVFAGPDEDPDALAGLLGEYMPETPPAA